MTEKPGWLMVFGVMILIFIILLGITILLYTFVSLVYPDAYAKIQYIEYANKTNVTTLAESSDSLLNPITVSGEVTDLMSGPDTTLMTVATKKKKNEPGYEGDPMYVTYPKNDVHLLEHDQITIYGYSGGVIRQSSVSGVQNTIPVIKADYIVKTGND